MAKQIKKMTVLFLVAATMFTIAACGEKENGNQSGNNPTPEQHGRMYGTSWTKTYEEHDIMDEGYYQDHYYLHRNSITLHFTTDSEGERIKDSYVYDDIQHDTTEHVTPVVTDNFTYVYKSGNLQYGEGVIYWENGDSSTFHVNNFYCGGRDNILVDGEQFPDNSFPCYVLDE